jgi:Uma2 family endonuclease
MTCLQEILRQREATGGPEGEDYAMIELPTKLRSADLPCSVRFYGVTEEMFDELVDEDTRAELLDGVMIVHSPASPRHNQIARFLLTLLGCYVEEKGLGAVFGPEDLIHLATCRKVAPDGFVLLGEHVPNPLPEHEFDGAPDLVIEVLSASNRHDDLAEKRPAYQQAGVREIWLVDPDQEHILVDQRQRKRYASHTVADGRLTSALLPGFWLEVSWLWAQPLPRVMPCLRKILR